MSASERVVGGGMVGCFPKVISFALGAKAKATEEGLSVCRVLTESEVEKLSSDSE